MVLSGLPQRVVGVGHDARAAGIDKAGHVALRVLDIEILCAVAVHGQRAGRVVGKVQLIAAPRQFHQLVAQIMVIVRRAVDGLRDALAVGIVGIRPRLPSRLIVLAHELVEAVVGVGRRALAVGDEELQWYGATHHSILLQIPHLTSYAVTAAVS